MNTATNNNLKKMLHNHTVWEAIGDLKRFDLIETIPFSFQKCLFGPGLDLRGIGFPGQITVGKSSLEFLPGMGVQFKSLRWCIQTG